MSDLVKYESDSGALVEITAQDVVDYICPTATAREVGLFLRLCQTQRLNPWVGEAYLVKYGDKPAQMIAGKEAFTKRAAANPDYEGFEAGITYADAQAHVRQREGSSVYPTVGEVLLGGWCRVYVKGKRPYYDEVALQEYNTGKSLWNSKPATMIRKVALVHCLREAFPDAFAGLYSAEEMGQDADSLKAPTEVKAANVEVEHEAPRKQTQELASAEDCERIGDLITELAEVRGVKFDVAYDAVFRSKSLQAAGFVDDGTLTVRQARAALGLLDKWLSTARASAKESASADESDDEAEYVVD